ncbi:hypothetical protein VCEC0051_002957B, partial [Vibrio cholerae O1 str. EC-0051]
LELQVGGK